MYNLSVISYKPQIKYSVPSRTIITSCESDIDEAIKETSTNILNSLNSALDDLLFPVHQNGKIEKLHSHSKICGNIAKFFYFFRICYNEILSGSFNQFQLENAESACSAHSILAAVHMLKGNLNSSDMIDQTLYAGTSLYDRIQKHIQSQSDFQIFTNFSGCNLSYLNTYEIFEFLNGENQSLFMIHQSTLRYHEQNWQDILTPPQSKTALILTKNGLTFSICLHPDGKVECFDPHGIFDNRNTYRAAKITFQNPLNASAFLARTFRSRSDLNLIKMHLK